jgi:hypothetical protein
MSNAATDLFACATTSAVIFGFAKITWCEEVTRVITLASVTRVPELDTLLALRNYLTQLRVLYPKRPPIDAWVLAGKIREVLEHPQNAMVLESFLKELGN